jgi:hypothetical protein
MDIEINTKYALEGENKPIAIINKNSNSKISFSLNNKDEILVLEKGWFWYKGNKIADINEAYEKFCNWLNRSTNEKFL